MAETAENNSKLAENDDKLAENNGRLAENNGKLAENNGKLAENNGKLAENNGKLAESNVKLAENNGRLAENNGQLAENNGRLAENNGQLAENNDKLAENNGRFAENNGQLAENNGKLVENNGRLAENNGKLVENNGRLVENNGKLAENNGRLAENNGKLAENNGRLAENNGKLAENGEIMAAGIMDNGAGNQVRLAENGEIMDNGAGNQGYVETDNEEITVVPSPQNGAKEMDRTEVLESQEMSLKNDKVPIISAATSVPNGTMGPALTMDVLLDKLGSPGCGQIFIYVLLCLNVFPVSLNFMAMSFYGASPNQTCMLPDGWFMNESIPLKKDGTYNGCQMYTDPQNKSLGTETCPNGYEYHLSGGRFPITAQWDLVCDREYLVRLAQSIFFFGVMIGGLVFGYLGDRFGRRPVTLVTLYSQAVLGIAVAFSTHYVMFVVLKFLQGMMLQGLQTSNNTMVMELFQTRYRTKAGMGVAMLATTCSMVIGLISFLIPNWWSMQLAISVPTIITLAFLWLLPESLRWLLTKQKQEAALRVAKRYSKLNRVQLPGDVAQNMESISKQIALNNTQTFKGNVIDLLKIPTVRRTSIILFFGWFTASVVYYGITLSIPNLSGNASLNFFIVGALETTARFIGYFIINKVGRRIPLSICFVLSGILCIISGCVNKALEDQNNQSIKTFTTIMALFGRACMGQCFAFILIVTSEVFPTVLRTIGSGACSFWTRVGGMIAPFTLLLDSYIGKATPFIVFGGLAIVAGGLSLFIPETMNVPLPDTVKEAGDFYREQQDKASEKGHDNPALENEKKL